MDTRSRPMGAGPAVDGAPAAGLRVEVVYALPDRQVLVAIDVDQGCTVRAAAERSSIARAFPGLDLGQVTFGIFGRVVAGEVRLRQGDRVEIYRPLIADPKAVRRARARGDAPAPPPS